MKFAKFLVKENNEWVHFTYIPEDAFEEFCKVDNRGWHRNEWVNRWAKRDFGIEGAVENGRLEELKQLIKKHYQELYPEVIPLSTRHNRDTHGWVRVWVCSNIKKETEIRWQEKQARKSRI